MTTRHTLIVLAALAAGLLASNPASAAMTLNAGVLIDDPGFLFDSFADHADATTRGANLGGGPVATWQGVAFTNDSTGATNGISWTGSTAASSTYIYAGLYTGDPGTAADADALTNFGIHGSPAINVTAAPGKIYTVDLLLANAFAPRNFDVSLDGVLIADNLTLAPLDGTTNRPLVYRFNVMADGNGIDLVFTPGGDPGDTNPFINAIAVTQVIPAPAALPAGLALMALAFTRRRARR